MDRTLKASALIISEKKQRLIFFYFFKDLLQVQIDSMFTKVVYLYSYL